MLQVREAVKEDFENVLELYLHLKSDIIHDDRAERTWDRILKSDYQHLILGFIDGCLVSSCIIDICDNLTHGSRPFAVIENVVTHSDYRRKGYASFVLEYAKEIAVENDCYKIMLMTGSKEEGVKKFYIKESYNSDDKIAFIQWL